MIKKFFHEKQQGTSEEELLSEIYTYSKEKLSELHERKRHIEIKTLYVLQASVIIVTLFTILLKYCDKFTGIFVTISHVFIGIFYIVLTLSVIVLLFALNDNISKLKFIKWKFRDIFEQMDNDYEIYKITTKTEENDDIKKGEYIETPYVIDLLNMSKKNKCNKTIYFKRLCKQYHLSIYSADKINIVKNYCFVFGTKLFIVALIIIISLGILIA